MPEAEFRPLPPEEAIKYFQSKGYQFSWDWHDMWHEDHTRAFTVAKAMREDILKDIRAEVDRALSEGTTLEEFKKNLTPVLQKKGWWGKVAVGDETGARVVQLGSPWRLRTIFNVNIQTAYQVGHYRAMNDPAVRKARPSWRYVAVNDSRTRPEHRMWHNTVLPADDPWWDTHYPPNGWNCFPEGTMVATPAGWREINRLKPGDFVIGGSGNIQPVIAVHKRPFNGEIVRLSCKGLQTSMTPNHRVLSIDGWKRADRVKPGDILVQLREIPGFNNSVIDVIHSETGRCQDRMSLPGQWESSICSAFNTKLNIRKKKVNPVAAKSIIEYESESGFFQKFIHKLFAIRQFHPGIWMRCRIYSILKYFGSREFFSYFRPFCRCSILQFISYLSYQFAVLLVNTLSDMTAFLRKFSVYLREQFGCLLSTHVIANPLSLYSLAAMPGFNTIMLHQPHQGSVVDIPDRADFPVRKTINDIAEAEGFTDGAPLDSFDSIDDFRTWASSHAELLRVDSIENIPYTGNVFNLSVAKDSSYCIPISVVHNCRCTVVSHSKRELDREGLDISKSPKIRTYEWINKKTGEIFDIPEGIDPGWAYNPGKDYPLYDVPKLGKVIPGQKTWRDYGRPDLRDIPESLKTPAPEILKKRRTLEEAVNLLATEIGIPEGKKLKAIKTFDDDLVIAHRSSLPHLVEKRDEARERYAKYILPTLQAPFEIWLTEYNDGFRKQYIGRFKGKRDLLVIVKKQRDGSFLWNIMHSDSKRLNNNRTGILLYGKK